MENCELTEKKTKHENHAPEIHKIWLNPLYNVCMHKKQMRKWDINARIELEFISGWFNIHSVSGVRLFCFVLFRFVFYFLQSNKIFALLIAEW